eukprot:10363335-Ditylum_brightwellii.AAC.1
MDENANSMLAELIPNLEPSNNELNNNNNNNNNSNKDNERQTCSLVEKWVKRVRLCKKNAFPFSDMKNDVGQYGVSPVWSVPQGRTGN